MRRVKERRRETSREPRPFITSRVMRCFACVSMCACVFVYMSILVCIFVHIGKSALWLAYLMRSDTVHLSFFIKCVFVGMFCFTNVCLSHQ